MKLNENIKALREELGMTQTELAEALFVTPQAVSRWEKGLAYPDIEKLPQLSAIFNVSVDQLLGVAPSTTHGLTIKLRTARDKARSGTPQEKLEYLSLLEKCFEIKHNLFITELLNAARRLREESIIPEYHFIEIFTKVKSRLPEIPLPHRNRILTNIVINESEERLSVWKEFITDDNNFACWHDLILFRYFVNGKEPEWSLQRSEVLFQDISKVLYLMNQKGSPSSRDMLHRKSDTVETCLTVKRIIDIFSDRDDDIFISIRINAETRLAANYLYGGQIDKFVEALKRMKVLLSVSRSLVGKRICGSTELFENYGFEYGIERFTNDYFEIEFLLESDIIKDHKELPEVVELIELIKTNRGWVDPFCSVPYNDRKPFENLYSIVKRRCETVEIKEDKTLFVFAVMTSKGNVYDFAVDISDTNGYNDVIKFLKRNDETQLTMLVGALHDFSNECCVSVPSHRFREMLCDLDKRNLDTRTILNGNYFYVVKTFRETMHPNVLIKYDE